MYDTTHESRSWRELVEENYNNIYYSCYSKNIEHLNNYIDVGYVVELDHKAKGLGLDLAFLPIPSHQSLLV